MLLDPGSGCASPLSIDGVAFGVGTWSTSRVSTVQVGQTVLDRYTAAERVAAERAAAERVAAERAAVERAAAERAAIEDDGEYPAQLLILITDVRDEYKVL